MSISELLQPLLITTYMFLGVLMASNPPSSILCGESGGLRGVR